MWEIGGKKCGMWEIGIKKWEMWEIGGKKWGVWEVKSPVSPTLKYSYISDKHTGEKHPFVFFTSSSLCSQNTVFISYNKLKNYSPHCQPVNCNMKHPYLIQASTSC